MKKFIILNNSQFPVLGTLNYAFHKLAKGFSHHGYMISEYTGPLSLNLDSKDNVILMGNHFGNHRDIISRVQKFSNAVFILWFYHDNIDHIPFAKWILTGEYFRGDPGVTLHQERKRIQESINNYVPFVFASLLSPSEMTKKHTKDINCQYIGTPYKVDWVRSIRCGNNFINMNPMSLDENTRLHIFSRSKICLGLHHDDNISNNVITERVFEGMSFANAVVTDNPIAAEETKAAIYCKNVDEFLKEIDHLLIDEGYRNAVVDAGLKYCIEKGSYYHSAKMFINKIEELYGK